MTTEVALLVHTRDSAATLRRLLESTDWIAERVIVDMQSGDETREIAREHGVRVLSAPPAPRVDGIRNDYLSEVRAPWTLVLDSDEYLAEGADEDVAALLAESEGVNAFAIPRHNRIAGQVLRGSGWYPDHQIRLFRRGRVRWADRHHGVPEVEGGREAVRYLQPPGCLHIHHENYRDLREFIERQVRYALTDAYPEEGFSFADYVRESHRQLARRHDPERDGELSRALGLVMAWDRLIRGLIHWDRLDRRPPLGPLLGTPVFTSKAEARIEALERELAAARAERDAARERRRRGSARALLGRLRRRLRIPGA